MADSDGLAFFLRASDGQFELLANLRSVLHIIEERNVAKAGAHSCALCSVKGHGCGSSAAIQKEKLARTKKRHQFLHQRRIRSSLRTLVIVHTDDVRDILQHSLKLSRNLRGTHAGADFLYL